MITNINILRFQYRLVEFMNSRHYISLSPYILSVCEFYQMCEKFFECSYEEGTYCVADNRITNNSLLAGISYFYLIEAINSVRERKKTEASITKRCVFDIKDIDVRQIRLEENFISIRDVIYKLFDVTELNTKDLADVLREFSEVVTEYQSLFDNNKYKRLNLDNLIKNHISN